MRKWITTFLLLASISAFIRPAQAQAPLTTEKPATGQITGKDDTLPLILIRIAYCESGNRQFGKDGKVLRGQTHPADLGIFQINSDVHLQEAQKLGYNIFTASGNIAFAKWLYEHQGTKPWKPSQTCWLHN